ncbi:small ribosomal subunit protein mS38 [Rhineura floridana]|uniref:small ribosomal subunit protein mS38 n=1 Tax=Rhineura floridana TaxID=261503 RepID=UPI002AC839C0|nr:small ribosomal subunit protein mS38 [Rhineura floridana]XP_061456845.1 small ribosomal subunit protein mS38 [Rhineura floridana]XP_061456846.1 small ribosomal subunit protein mS38 [Rhineura floridana]XP_061456847.1 small ribosomal subunit protein mS38 [Rhineura floridana]XP_061456848.1 small ribosomal subunit protein mS38 [Rhineura floridana]
MLLSRLTSQIARASRFAERFLLRTPAPLPNPRLAASANYSTHPSNRNGAQPQQWLNLDPDLEEILVPRKMSISPLESWLTVQYILPSGEGATSIYKRLGYEPAGEYDLPPCSWGAEDESEEGGELNQDKMECKNVLKIRRRKMNKHKYRKLMKRTKFLRKKIREGRRRRKQKRFERDLERIWRGAGLRKPPKGWVTPKIYLRLVKSD